MSPQMLDGSSRKLGSGVHRLFEGQGQKEGHFSARFGSQEGSLSCFNQPWGQFSVFCQPRGHFSVRFGSQEGTLTWYRDFFSGWTLVIPSSPVNRIKSYDSHRRFYNTYHVNIGCLPPGFHLSRWKGWWRASDHHLRLHFNIRKHETDGYF